VASARPSKPARRARVTIDRIVETALAILDDLGRDGLTTTEIAWRLNISQPTLYSHVENLQEIKTRVAIFGVSELSERVRTAVLGRVGNDALYAMAYTYRAYVTEHPERYLLMLTTPKTPEHQEAAERAAFAVRAVLRSYGLPEAQIAEVHLIFRSSIHGFVHLEANQALGSVDADKTFDVFVGMMAAGIHSIEEQAIHAHHPPPS